MVVAHIRANGLSLEKDRWNEIERGKEQKEREQKEGTSRAERTIQVVVEARQHQNGSERGSRFMLGSQRSHSLNKTNSGFVNSSEGVGRKDECQVRLTGIEREYWMGTEISR